MKKGIASALAALLAVTAHQSLANQSAPVASTGFGGGISLPGGATFVPWSFDSNWKPHGSSGAPGAGFVIECSPATENAADFGLVLNGTADFRETGDGGIEAVWSVHANRNGSPRFVGLQCTVPKTAIPGGLRADDADITVGTEIPPSPHIFSGKVRRFEFLGTPAGGLETASPLADASQGGGGLQSAVKTPAGGLETASPLADASQGGGGLQSAVKTKGGGPAPWLVLEFPEPQEILVQDNIRWSTQNVSLRIILAADEMEAGRDYKTRVVFRVPNESLSLSIPETVRVEPGPDWIPLPPPAPGTDWIAPGSALDFSAIVPHHEPAGKFGRVIAVGEHFEFEGRPGEEVRFCGVNLVHGANVPEPENADRFAANLARMGFNSVRIHHHEAFLSGAKPRGDGAALDVPDRNWRKFDALVAACVRHGLYLTTDLFVSRTKGMTWRAIGIDRDGTVPDREFKLMCAFYEPAYSNLVAWTRLFLGHWNPHTGRTLAEEPALCALGFINEGNLGRDGVDGLKKCPGFAEAWAQWSGGAPLPTDVYGAASGDLARFLAEREAALFARLEAEVRALGCRAPLSNLNAGYYPGQYLEPMRDFDYIDTHFYAYHPRFLGKNWQFPTVIEAENPLVVNGGVPSAAWRRVFGKPFCITEWNWAAPGRTRAASGLVAGSLAALQGWSGLWRFAWSHNKQGVEAPGSVPIRFFDLHGDPVQRASEYATIALFLRGDMPPLPPETESAEVLSEEELRTAARARQFGAARKGVSAWERRVGARLEREEAKEEVAKGEAVSRPPSLSTTADWSPPLPCESSARPVTNGSFRVVTPRTCGGFAESGALECGALCFELLPPPQEGQETASHQSVCPAAIWATSLDGAPLAESRRILVAHVTDAANTGAVFDGPEARSWIEQGTTPPLVRRGRADISLALDEGSGAKPPSFAVYRLSPTGERVAEVPASCREGEREAPHSRTVAFLADTAYDPSSATLFYEIIRE